MSADKLDTFDDEFNPFQAPVAAVKGPALIDGPADLREAELIRRKYLNHEASVKAIGWLNFLGALFFIPGGIFVMLLGLDAVSLPDQRVGETEKLVMAGLGFLLLALGVLGIFVGIGLRKLRPWARITQGVLSILNALASLVQLNPFGVLIPGYIAYLMLSAKGQMVCSPEYQRVIAATPHIKYKTHWLVKALLVVLLLLLLLIIGGLIFSSMSN